MVSKMNHPAVTGRQAGALEGDEVKMIHSRTRRTRVPPSAVTVRTNTSYTSNGLGFMYPPRSGTKYLVLYTSTIN